MINRRTTIKLLGATVLSGAASKVAAAAKSSSITWVTTTRGARWQAQKGLAVTAPEPSPFKQHVQIVLDKPQQTISGFGGAFSERGWDALSALPARLKGEALSALFSDSGAAFNTFRTPVGANDFSRKWYSYDETPGDFDLNNFSISNDRETLIPFIKSALAIRPDLNLWASPWSPPTWMKSNGHYAMVPNFPGLPANGMKPEQRGQEGRDYFIQEDRYFDAYARYFRRYIEEYRKAGVNISMVMPQNEFNSAQPFPSCCWTPEGLARFIPFLGREMEKTGTDIFFGTLERPNADLLTAVVNDPEAGRYIKGVGIQWGGKGALEDIQRRHPTLAIWGSEQECGTGANDWHYTRYGWDLIKRYFRAGASAWHYWNMALPLDGLSGWGWQQNALISVDTRKGVYTLTNDYWLMKHLSAFIRKGARFIPTDSFQGYENQLAFRNPNGDVVIVIQNDLSTPLSVGMVMGDRQIAPNLPADSFNTIVIPAEMLR